MGSTMHESSSPLVPAECDLRNFQFMPFDVQRLLTSETWILGTGDERAAAITLWMESWHQIPAGSLPNNDRMLAHLSQAGTKWKRVKAHALRGWVEASDGRLYHPVVAEKALEAWIEKLSNSISGATGNAKRWGVEVDIDSLRMQFLDAVRMLREIAPQSPALKKKIVATIAAESPPDTKNDRPPIRGESPPDSPPDSGRDRKGQGQGQGYISLPQTPSEANRSGSDPGGTGASDDQPYGDPKPAAELAKLLRSLGVQLTPANPDFRQWVDAKLTADEAMAAVDIARATKPEPEPIPWAYLSKVLATQRNASGAAPGEADDLYGGLV